MIFRLVLFLGIYSATADIRTNLDVYYESICPDSRRFFINQLQPTWDVLSPYVNLRLIPFGKASFSAKPNQGWTFRCHHGPDECTGNILHACGIKYSPNTRSTVTYATCLMNSPTEGAKCASKAGLDYKAISKCSSGLEGENLLQSHGQETLQLSPRMSFVPWLIFNKEWDYDNQWKGLENITSAVCQSAKLQADFC